MATKTDKRQKDEDQDGGFRLGAMEAMLARQVRDGADLRDIIGARFLEARELNGYPQGVAGTKMGFERGSQLSLVEHGRRPVSIDMLVQASKLYMVSTDFLLGLSEEPDRDRRSIERTAAIRHYDDLIRNSIEGVTALLMRELGDFAPMSDTWKALESAIAEMLGAYATFRQINAGEFEDMRGGARLESAAARLDLQFAAASEVMRGKDGVFGNITAAMHNETPKSSDKSVGRKAT